VGDAAGEPAGVAEGPAVAGGEVAIGDGPPEHAATRNAHAMPATTDRPNDFSMDHQTIRAARRFPTHAGLLQRCVERVRPAATTFAWARPWP
jgi:hypothetical protein